jgi:hypothetical protein
MSLSQSHLEFQFGTDSNWTLINKMMVKEKPYLRRVRPSACFTLFLQAEK